MTSTITDRKPSAVEFEIVIPWAEFLAFAETAARRLSKAKPIKGFRPGNAPYWAAARDLGAMTVLEAALADAVPATLAAAVRQEKLETIGEPSIEVQKLAPENPVVYRVRLLLLPEMSVGDLSKIELAPAQVRITPEDVDKVLTELRTLQAAELPVSRSATVADAVTVDLTMSIGGVPMEGGNAKGHIVRLSEKHYIPGFAEQLLGMSAGGSKTFQLEFPKEHYQKHLAGRAVDFAVTATEVRERTLPPEDDAFAVRLGQKTLGDLRALVENNLRQEKEEKERQRFERALLAAVLLRTRFGEIPDFLITEEAQRILQELQENIERQGGAFADYLTHLGKTRDQLLLDISPQALQQVKTALLLRHLAKQQNISVSDEEVTLDIERTREAYAKNSEVLEALDLPRVREQVRLFIRNKKVIEWLKVKVTGNQ